MTEAFEQSFYRALAEYESKMTNPFEDYYTDDEEYGEPDEYKEQLEDLDDDY